MRLKQLKLENIRSHQQSEINFPEGSLLLSGDIGSGKSSILLGIEFALFGIQKGALSGSALLRNGAREGKVELTFSLGGNDITISRSLKKGASSISQDAGFITINGAKEIGTAVELKSKILELLGYPKEFLTKKNLLYRYTVYTPQEEMKQILFDSAEDRLNILRKVFDIEKYKRVKENCSIYLREMRERKRNLEGMLSGLAEKKLQLTAKKEQHEKVVLEITTLQPKSEFLLKTLQEKQQKMLEFEMRAKEIETQKQELKVLDSELGLLVANRKIHQEELVELEKQLTEMKAKIPALGLQDIGKKIAEAKGELVKLQVYEKECSMKITECKTRQKTEQDMLKKILEIDNCPVCLQYVTQDHKEHISSSSEEKVTFLKEHLSEHEEMMKKTIKDMTKMQLKQEYLLEQQKQAAVVNEQKKHVQEKEERSRQINKFIEDSKVKIGEINVRKIALQEKVINAAEVEVSYKHLKEELVTLQGEERSLAVQLSSLQKEKEMGLEYVVHIEKEIKEKEDKKKDLDSLNKLVQWLQDHFTPLMDVMEKHVFTSIYYQFNERFQHWFSVLIEDETITVRLDDMFTPIVEQNGYETSLEHLSGGEKTSCALAYRLALNKAINDLIGQINTKDLLILDEPTDGFSSEQLDKVRDVLDELNLGQILLVSHENKIESFVDHVIRVEKVEHSSRIS